MDTRLGPLGSPIPDTLEEGQRTAIPIEYVCNR